MYDKQKFLDDHPQFKEYRLVEDKDLREGCKLLYVQVRGYSESQIFFDEQPAELRDNFREEGIFKNLNLKFLNIFLPNFCPGGKYDSVSEVEVLAKKLDVDVAHQIRGRIYLISRKE